MMSNTKIDNAANTDMTANVTDYESPAAQSTSQIEYTCSDWDTWNGIVEDVPVLDALISAKAIWTVGKGYKVKDETDRKRLEKIRGNGKQTFNTILCNAVRVYTIGGDFFAEILETKKGGLLNLKPINPSMMKIIANSHGIIIGYEQWANWQRIARWTPEQMFHLSWQPIADQIHGQSTVAKLKNTTEAYKEARNDMKTVFHRYVKPLIISIVDTDDTSEIAAYKAKLDIAVEKGENMVVPKGTLDSMEKMSVPQYSTLDPLPWIANLEREFFIAQGVPAVIVGSTEKSDTEASAKILYLSFQQVAEWNQMFLKEQIKAQLGMEIELEFPAKIDPAVQQDQSKARKMNNMETGIGNASGGKK